MRLVRYTRRDWTKIQCPKTEDMVCGGMNGPNTPVAVQNQCAQYLRLNQGRSASTNPKDYDGGPSKHCSFVLSNGVAAAAQCLYSSMAEGLTKASVQF